MNNDKEQKILLLIEELEDRIEKLESELKKIKNLQENSLEKQPKKVLLKD